MDPGQNSQGPPTLQRGRTQIIITMDAHLGCQVAHNCPSGDVVEMLLYRALKYAERELTAGRLFKVELPKITIENSLPKGLE